MFSKVTKKVVATALILSLAFSAGAIAPSQSATAAPKLSIKKKISVSVLKKVTLKANVKATWSVNNKNVTLSSKSGKSIKVEGRVPGKAVITAKAGSKKATCTVTIKKATKGTVVYDLAKEKTAEYAAPVVCKYEEFKYSNYAINLFRAVFYQKSPRKEKDDTPDVDFRGNKFNISVTLKNTGKRDLPELGFCFNYTKGDGGVQYPFVYHVKATGVDKKTAKLKNHKYSKNVKAKIKKGKTYTYKFSFKLPAKVENGDKDSDGVNYPIMFFIPNMKDSSPYKAGDAITITKCKITVA